MKTSNIKNMALPGWLAVATVWFANHAGGGFASGQQEVRFFVQQGWSSIWMPFISMLVVGAVMYLSLNFARLTKSYDFRTWVQKFYSPYDKLFANLLDVMFIVFLCLPAGAAIAGGASLLTEHLSIPYILATLIACSILVLFTIFGSSLVRRFSLAITAALLIMLGIIVYFGISSNYMHSAAIIHERTVPEGVSMFSILKWVLLYAGFQSVVAPYVSVAEPLKTHGDTVKMALTGVIINGAALFLVCWMLLGAYPAVLSKDIPLPVLHVIKGLNMPLLEVCYSVMLFMAFISTGVTFIFASVRRFENAKIWNKLSENHIINKSSKTRCTVIALVTIAYAFGVSQFGLVKIIAYGYQYMGITQLLLIVIPVLIIGPVKCRNARRAAKKNVEIPENATTLGVK